MATKFWTVVDGVLGTAHTGRDGSLKDFREAKVTWRHWGLAPINSAVQCSVTPSDGVTPKVEVPVRLEATGKERVKGRGEAEYRYTEFRCTAHHPLFTEVVFSNLVELSQLTTAAVAAVRLSRETERQALEEQTIAVAAATAAVKSSPPDGLDARLIGLIKRSSKSNDQRREIIAAWQEFYGVTYLTIREDEVANLVLTADDARRKVRAAAWRAKKD